MQNLNNFAKSTSGRSICIVKETYYFYYAVRTIYVRNARQTPGTRDLDVAKIGFTTVYKWIMRWRGVEIGTRVFR